MLEINKRVLEVKIDGVVYKLKYPTVLQLKQLSEAAKSLESNKTEELELLISLLETLGLPKAVSYELEPEAFQKIIEILSGAQKKS